MRIKPVYFVLALVIFFAVCYFVGNNQLDENNMSVDNSYLIHVTPDNISDSISGKTCIVLFYISNSDVCKNMEYKLNQLAMSKDETIPFYTVNVDNEIKTIDKYNISGVPSILLFRNGKEYKRIMGVIPAYNLKMIYERDIK